MSKRQLGTGRKSDAIRAESKDASQAHISEGLFGRCLYWACCCSGYVLSKLLLRAEVIGGENFPRQGRVIFASNHRSYVDPVLIGFYIPRPVHFVAKEELFSNPVFGWLLRNVHAFAVRRSGIDREMLRQAMRVLDSERALLIFPEGTRSKTDSFLPAKPGIGLLAAKSGAPVVPTYIHNTGRILPPGAKMLRFRKLYLCFAEPVGPPVLSGDAVPAEVYSDYAKRVMESIARLRDDLLARIGQCEPNSGERTS